MRAVVATEPGVVELNWLWLPTIIGMNAELKVRLEKKLASKVQGLPLTEGSLDHIHDVVIETLCEEFSYVKGLKEYLQAMKHASFDTQS